MSSGDRDRGKKTVDFVGQVKGQLIVSCQALADEPLFGAEIMARMAIAARQGGAKGIRANSPDDIRAIRAAIDLPIIGLFKEELPGYEVYITPTLPHARAVATAGADVIAVDASDRPRPEGDSLAEFISAIQRETGCPVLADISTFNEGVAAAAAGADMVSTTMSGYTEYSPAQAEPDTDLVRRLADCLPIPVLAEGRYKLPDQVRQALDNGAVSVVIGGAITRPQQITQWFVDAVTKHEP
jgi:N-acylglucosamine-6-phosphate 2-epimerase